jgi:spore germination cell wall hydrolase CwlJ-like protein
MVTLTSTILCLSLTVYHEARGEPLHAQKAVANVVLNRSLERNKSICEIVTEPNQFSWVKNKSAPNPTELDAWIQASVVASDAIDRNERDNTRGANHFFNHRLVRPVWVSDCSDLRVYGSTTFCKIKR